MGVLIIEMGCALSKAAAWLSSYERDRIRALI